MTRLAIGIVGLSCFLLGEGTALGQTIWTQPAPVVWKQPAPVVWTQPAPVVWSNPAPLVVQRAPVVVSPPPVMAMSPVTTLTPIPTVVRAPIVTYQPVRRTYTRRRPILGGTVTRSWVEYQRVVF
jgi:hypothetical protein